MKITLKNIIQIIPRYSKNVFAIFFYKFLSFFYTNKEKFRNAWIICERGIEAQDNGYMLFKYIRTHYPEKKVYYLIDFSMPDYDRVKELGNVICYNSYKHKMALFFASHFISTHVGFMMPWSYLLFKTLFRGKKNATYVMLNHGVVKDDDSKKMNKRLTGLDIFVATTKPEKEWLISNRNYGLKEKDVPLTGAGRYDYFTKKQPEKQIVFLPTWRKYLIERNIEQKNNYDLVKDFEKTTYFKAIFEFLNNKRVHLLLQENNARLIFRPHPEAQRMCSLLTHLPCNIIIANNDNTLLLDLLQESAMLITDYSSVAFDFAYMKKPLIYYQFDHQEFLDKHYAKGYFDYDQDGFGTVVNEEDQLINEIERIIANDFSMEELYMNRVDNTFLFHDNKNCERIYNAIINYR
ncbi:MAG: CDP-glycerol glycerophosphotransferase family protein [Bacteroidales bacterium]|jgi:hypothetical protein|nr:CDP-glycerol glycerophosphotransferase family protein [Bacteroidales bacterium]